MNALGLSIAVPLLGALVTGLAATDGLAKKAALVFASLELLVTLTALWWFQPDQGGFQLHVQYPWIPSLNSHIELGIDGISVLFLPMTAFFTLLAVLSAWHCPGHRGQLAGLLFFEAMAVGMYSALDMLLFYAFWQLSLPAVFFLTGLGEGGPSRRSTASKCLLFITAGGVPLLIATVLLAINHATQHVPKLLPEQLSFSVPELLGTPVPESLQGWVFLLLLTAFAIKAPLVPLHTWLPAAALDAPVPLSALLMGLNLGCYGIIRFAIPLAPSAAIEYNWALGMLGAVSLIYAALVALQQSNLRRLLAFASISQTGLAVIGLASLNLQGIQGALLQLFNTGLTSTCLLLLAGMVRQRLGSTEQSHLGGLAHAMPCLAGCYFWFASASVGLPFSSGFPAELLVLFGSLTGRPSLGVIALVGTVLAVAYSLSAYRRTFLGPLGQPARSHLTDLQPREWAILAVPAFLLLLLGLWPNALLSIHKVSAQQWLTRLLDQPGMEGEELAFGLPDRTSRYCATPLEPAKGLSTRPAPLETTNARESAACQPAVTARFGK